MNKKFINSHPGRNKVRHSKHRDYGCWE